jgi:hypothetical protein
MDFEEPETCVFMVLSSVYVIKVETIYNLPLSDLRAEL